MLDCIEEFDQGSIVTFFFQQAAWEAKFENALSQSIRCFCALPDELSEAGLDLQGRNCGNPGCLAHKK